MKTKTSKWNQPEAQTSLRERRVDQSKNNDEKLHGGHESPDVNAEPLLRRQDHVPGER